MIGIELVKTRQTLKPHPKLAGQVITSALKKGLILLSGGNFRNVLTLTPPLGLLPSAVSKSDAHSQHWRLTDTNPSETRLLNRVHACPNFLYSCATFRGSAKFKRPPFLIPLDLEHAGGYSGSEYCA